MLSSSALNLRLFFKKNRYNVETSLSSIADKGKTVSFDKIGCTSAIEASFIALGLHYFCHFLFRSSAHEESGGTNFHRSADMDFMLLQPFVAL